MDRTVHAYDDHVEIVRYDRRGKWMIESWTIESHEGHRLRQYVSLDEAVSIADRLSSSGGVVRFGLPGGRDFERRLRQRRRDRYRDAVRSVARVAEMFSSFADDDEPLYVVTRDIAREVMAGEVEPDFTLGELRAAWSLIDESEEDDG